jgi:hypothetical protein
MKSLTVCCDDCGRPCEPGEFLTLSSGPGSQRLKAMWSDQKELCPECVEAHINLGRQRRHEDADERPVRRRVGATL